MFVDCACRPTVNCTPPLFSFLKRSIREHAKATELHVAQITKQLTVAQANLGHHWLRWRSFELALVNARDAVADQSSLAANARRFFDASLQKSTEDFFMAVLHHAHAGGLVIRTNTS